ncbi:MAG: hypothetical protein AAB766_02820 [Patescibacteria group bacterium]
MAKEGNNKKKKKVPTDPNWKCVECNFELFLGFFQRGPRKCPRCQSFNVVDLRSKRVDD